MEREDIPDPHKLRLKLHIKHTTKKQTNTSHQINVTNCPCSTSEFEDLSRRVSFEELMDEVRSAVKLD